MGIRQGLYSVRGAGDRKSLSGLILYSSLSAGLGAEVPVLPTQMPVLRTEVPRPSYETEDRREPKKGSIQKRSPRGPSP